MPQDDEIVSLVEPACISKDEFKQAVLGDICLQQVKSFVMTSWPPHKCIREQIKPFFNIREELSVVDDLLLRAERLVVPSSLSAQIIATAHETHQGITRTKARLREQFWWPGMDKEVETAVKNCSVCLEADKSAKTSPAPMQPVEWPQRPWQKLCIDIVGPLEHVPQNNRFIITLVDYHSKWPEAYFCSSVSTSTVKEFLTGVFSREGYPEEIVTDNGPQFISREFKEFLHDRAIRLSHSSVYYPQANGQVERFNRTLKNYVQVCLLERQPLRQAVTEYLGVYRCTPHATTGVAPAVLLHGRMPRTRLHVVGFSAPAFEEDPAKELSRLRQRIKKQQQRSKQYADRRRAAKETAIAVGDFVRVRKPSIRFKGDSVFSPPTKVVKKQGPSSFRLQDGRTWNASKLSKVSQRSQFQPCECSSELLPLPGECAVPCYHSVPTSTTVQTHQSSALPASPAGLPTPQPSAEPAVAVPVPQPTGVHPTSSDSVQSQPVPAQTAATQATGRPQRERRPPAWSKDYVSE